MNSLAGLRNRSSGRESDRSDPSFVEDIALSEASGAFVTRLRPAEQQGLTVRALASLQRTTTRTQNKSAGNRPELPDEWVKTLLLSLLDLAGLATKKSGAFE